MRRSLRLVTAFTATAATALSVAPATAHAATGTAKATWRVSLRTHGGAIATETVATGKKTAWTFTANERGSGIRAFHLGGGKGRAVALPRAADGPVTDSSASSDRNVWIATMGSLPGAASRASAPSPVRSAAAARAFGPSVARLLAQRPALGAAGREKNSPARVLRWDGRKWTTMKSFPGMLVTAIAAPSARDVRVFGVRIGSKATPIAWRFNGKTWKSSTIRTQVSDVTFRSSRDIWAAGFDNSGDGREVVQHYDGRSWRRERMPIPSGGVFFFGIASDRNRVWVTGDGMEGHSYAFLRDRRGWHRERIPGADGLGTTGRPFLTDRGEFVLMGMPVDEDTPPAYRERMIMFHRKSTGKWHVDVVPDKIGGRPFDAADEASPLPGTGSILVGGALDEGGRSTTAAVAVYRPNH